MFLAIFEIKFIEQAATRSMLALNPSQSVKPAFIKAGYSLGLKNLTEALFPIDAFGFFATTFW